MQNLMDKFTISVLENDKVSITDLYNSLYNEHPEIDQYMPQFIQLGDAIRYAPQIIKNEILQNSLKRSKRKDKTHGNRKIIK